MSIPSVRKSCLQRVAAPWSVAALVLSSAALCATGASAQDAPANAQDTVAEVVVTAQFRAENVQTTPLAITAVNAAMLESRSQTSIADVTAQAPNVQLRPAGAAFGNSLTASIRGVGQGDFNPALEPGVGMYVDDVYYSSLTGSIFDLLDLDRVEILRGPQGTLSGKASIGGAVKLYSKKPSNTNGGFIEGTYGSYKRTDVRASGNFVVIPDKLFVRLAGVSKHRDGYVDRIDFACANPGPISAGVPTLASSNCKIGTEGGKAYTALRASVRWLATEKLEINLIGDATHEKSEATPNTLLVASQANCAPPACTPASTYSAVPYDSRFIPSDKFVTYSSYNDPGGVYLGIKKNPFYATPQSTLKGVGFSGTVDYKLADKLALKTITAYRYYKSEFGNDNDASPLVIDQGAGTLTHRQFQQELRLNGTLFDDKVDFTLGGFYFRQKTIYATRQDLLYVSPLFDFVGNDPVVAHTKAAFAHAVWHVTDKLNLTGGVRYSDEDKSYTYYRFNPGTTTNHPILGNLSGVTGVFEGKRWDYRINANYQWTSAFMTYFETATGYKGGGINPRPFNPGQVLPFNPETLTSYELGFKSNLFDRRVRLNASAFYNKYKDIQFGSRVCQVTSPTYATTPCAQIQNAGNATVKGAEVETELHPMPGLTIDGSLSYLDFNYTYISPLVAGITTASTPAGVGKWKWSVGAQYEVQMGEMGSLTPRVDVFYQSSFFGNANNSNLSRVPAYTVANARLTWRPKDGDWEVSAEATNFTNKLYYINMSDFLAFGGYITGQPAQPRSYAVTVKKRF
jgi:iron complex outermembrane receptor protein